MKKKLYIIALLILISTFVGAQNPRFGIEIGSNYSFFHEKSNKVFNSKTEEPTGKFGLNLGMSYTRPINEWSDLQLLLQIQGRAIGKNSFAATDVSGNLMGNFENTVLNAYLNLGASYVYRVSEKISIFAGLKPHFLALSIQYFKHDLFVCGHEMDPIVRNRYFRNFCMSAPVGLRYSFDKLYISVQYDLALTPSMKVGDSYKRFDNVVELNLGIFLYKSKKNK